ncbi:MAG TPA: response regulator transcription factor [Vicinamibacterales bacterium]|nr:response regulator transcription factor [Vicinamibacterales bacterium]
MAIIEDQREFREGLAFLIDGTEGYRCAQRFGSMEEALDPLGRDPPDVALLDIGLPGISGIEGIRLLREQCPGLPVLVLTIYNDDERIFGAMCAGACGYLLKKTPKARILECIEDVLDGGAPMSPDVARRVVELFRKFRPPQDANYHLTKQELRLLTLLGEGHYYKTAAGELGITINTVSSHMRHIYEKLQVHSKSEAVAKALRQGLIH